MFGTDRNALRERFMAAWRKARDGLPMEPLEAVIADVAGMHPEYHRVLEADPEVALGRDYLPEDGETNPFLHMGLHIGLREQIGTDRPEGIAAIYRELCERAGDRHAAEHAMMDCLAQAMWEAQRGGVAPDERAYLDALRALVAWESGPVL